MHGMSPWDNPNLAIALALMVGMLAQAVAVHLRLPGIVLLLAAGVALGPDVLNVIRPEALGSGLSSLVGFAVAVILFEGGLALDIPQIRRSGKPIQRLLTVGSLVTALLATLVAYLLMGWDWSLAALFGTLVIVTGPTVVTPLLKRLKVKEDVGTILEAEGVLIDPIGAIIAFVTLEVVLWSHGAEAGVTPLEGFTAVFLRLGLGTVIGLVAGALLSKSLTRHGLIPEGLTNVLTLATVLAIYQVSESVLHESGIAAVTAAGVIMRFMGTPVERELIEFKEQLTVMLIGMLFVLLAADVRIEDVMALGWQGAATALALLMLVRPATVFISTVGTELDLQQKLFLSWIGPRGIVAAAVASLFAVELEHAHIDGGTELRALVFLVIAVTVVVSGLTGGWVAQMLGQRRPTNVGWVLLGAHPLSRAVGRELMSRGEEVLLVDVNHDNCDLAEAAGLAVICQNGLKQSTLESLALETRAGVLALTANEEVNYLFSQRARLIEHAPRAYVALRHEDSGVTTQMVREQRAEVLFGAEVDVVAWDDFVNDGDLLTARWRLARSIQDGSTLHTAAALHREGSVLPILVQRGDRVVPTSDAQDYQPGDEVVFLVVRGEQVWVDHHLRAGGWEPLDAEE